MAETDNLLRACGLVPADFGVPGAIEVTYRGAKRPRCPDCGARVRVALRIVGKRMKVRVRHPAPVCAEFARRIEEQP
jgi:hypothetical protein